MSHDSAIHACPDFLADFSDFVDGTLTPGRRSQIEVHLDCCEACLRHLAAYRRGIETYRDVSIFQVDPDEFWLGLRIRLASDKESAPPEPPRRIGWRAPAMAGAAVAVLALSVLWVGTRIDSGLQQLVETAQQPVFVAAGAAVGGGSAPVVEPVLDAPEVARPGARSAPTMQLASAAGRNVDRAVADAALEREFESLREEIETAAWLGDPYLEGSSRTFEPARLNGAQIQTVDFRPSEPIPVVW
jgi:anti-sigma factor RsiW